MSPFAKAPVDPALLAQQQGAGSAKAAAKALKGQPSRNEAAAAKAAQDFEAMFIAQMLQPMFAGLEGGEGLFGGGAGEDAYRGLMVEEYGKAIARAGGIGIADQVRAEMLKLQEVE